MEHRRQSEVPPGHERPAKYEDYQLLKRVGIFVAILNACGIAVWGMGLFQLPGYVPEGIDGARVVGLMAALVLLGISADVGRPRGFQKDSRRLRWAALILLAATTLTIVAESRLIYEGMRIVTSLPH